MDIEKAFVGTFRNSVKNPSPQAGESSGSKIAAYRDENGRLYRRSAVCTHMGCLVRFNSLEKTWDCPCHGSRFRARDGQPVNTPAITPLENIEE